MVVRFLSRKELPMLVSGKRAVRACLILIASSAVFGAASAQESALNWRIPELAPPDPVRAQEFAARRRALADSMADGVLVVFGARSPAQDYMAYQQTPPSGFSPASRSPMPR